MFLCTTCGLLRGESVFKADLSDLFGLEFKPTRRDPTNLFILVFQIAAGKINPNYKIFGRMARNFDVDVCPIGALAFYLHYRFHHTQEMDDPLRPIDWGDNSTWFHIKLLNDFSSARGNQKCIQDSTYGNAIKKICKEKHIPTKHYVHIGRVLGAMECELNEDDCNQISQLGNWSLTTQESRYSTKMPLAIIRSKARMNHNLN